MNNGGNETRKIAYETWRFQVDSYWTRNSYFAAFEVAAAAGVWKLTDAVHYWMAFCLAIVCAGLTAIWFIANTRVHEYIEFWWAMAIDSDPLNASETSSAQKEFGLASRFEDWRRSKDKRHRLRYSHLVQIIPTLFLIGWLCLGCYSLWQGFRNPSAAVASSITPGPQMTSGDPRVSLDLQGALYDKALAIATFLLVAVGAFQIFYLWRTVNATRDNAMAAKASADAIVNVERAWILLGEFGEERHNYKIDGIDILLTFRNYGKTPAWIVESSFRFMRITEEASRLPLEYETPAIFSDGEPVPPGKSFPSIRRSLELAEELAGRPGEGEVIFFGFIRYRDVFYSNTKTTRETYVRMRFERTQHDIIFARPGRWVYDGPPDANRHT